MENVGYYSFIILRHLFSNIATSMQATSDYSDTSSYWQFNAVAIVQSLTCSKHLRLYYGFSSIIVCHSSNDIVVVSAASI